MFFTRNKKQNSMEISSCVDGDVVPLDEVPDQIFAQHVMGEGIAVNPDNDTVFAPCDGEITLISESEHVIGMTCENGSELLIHVGIDTAEMQGDGFEILTGLHDYVYESTPLLSFDLEKIKEKGLCPYVMIICPKNDKYAVALEKEKGHVQANHDILMTVMKR